jgi:hypothetical protein
LLLSSSPVIRSGRVYSKALAETSAIRFLHFGGTTPHEITITTSALATGKLSRVKKLIETSLDQDLTLESLAKGASTAKPTFFEVF